VKSNPSSYYKFNCRNITHIQVLSKYKILQLTQKEFTKELIANHIIAIASNDGLFTIYDFSLEQPILIARSDFGSFNCFEFSEDYRIVILGGQDDAITVLNLS